MRETVEFRVPKENAEAFLSPTDGVRLGMLGTRKIDVDVSEPLFARIKELDREFRRKGKSFFFGWRIRRHYTKGELQAASAFLANIKYVFEPAGEECGTIYDDSTACDFCGVGAMRRTELILPPKRLPKRDKLAIAETIAGERIVSAPFVELFHSHNLRGAEFRPVNHETNPSLPIPGWHELVITSGPVSIVPPTQGGVDVFDDGSEAALNPNAAAILAELKIEASWCDKHSQHRCPLGHTLGLNLISELTVARSGGTDWDIARTEQSVGVRRGLLRPRPFLLISKRLWQLIERHRLKGIDVEVAHIR